MKPLYTVAAIIFVLVGIGVGTLVTSTNTDSVGGRNGANDDAGAPYQEIVDPSGFVNSEEFTIGELIGKKVILVDFMTYSCINCQRTFPYVNAWYEKYKDQGLAVIGIHTPEFAFEKDIDNVRDAMKKFGISHPVVLDNEYATWNAYGNKYWPRKYLIDIHGNIVYDHIGEGAYEETEKKIQELLKERADMLGEEKNITDVLASSNIPTVDNRAGSPEIYFGAWRNDAFGSGVPRVEGVKTFPIPGATKSNVLYLSGTWNITKEYAESVSASRVHFLYTGKSVYFVAGASPSVEMEVLLDGAPVPQGKRGTDIVVRDGKTYLTVSENHLYKIIEDSSQETHVLEFVIPKPGLQAFTFTFG